MKWLLVLLLFTTPVMADHNSVYCGTVGGEYVGIEYEINREKYTTTVRVRPSGKIIGSLHFTPDETYWAHTIIVGNRVMKPRGNESLQGLRDRFFTDYIAGFCTVALNKVGRDKST